ncbi:sensor histidine kinase DpiB [Lachnospiraceae bacterium]|nr:sensor histidine kinase DpiB [Lachnospiraceae bacterium]
MAGYMAAAVNGWEAFCCVLFFRSFAQMRPGRNRRKVWALMGIQAFFCMMLGLALPGSFYGRVAVVSLLVSFSMLYLFQIRYLASLVLAMFFLGLDALMEYLSVVAARRFLPLVFTQNWQFSELSTYGLVLFTSRVLLFCSILLMRKILKGKAFYVLTGKEWRILFISTFLTLVTFTQIAEKVRLDDDTFLYFVLTILVIDYVVYYLIDEIIAREIRRKEDEVFREQVKYETAMYHSISENLERQRKRTHEYKNQISVISALAAARQYQELLAYVEKADAALGLHMDAIDTNHVIVNAILNTKYREATDKGIVFVLKANDLSRLWLREEDIVLILSNLLNNAMEACEHSQEKVIRLKFVLEEKQAVISVKNSMAGPPVVEDGKFQTTKTKDVQEHGMGIRNVIETVENYGGKYTIGFDRGGFVFSIILPDHAGE